MTVMQRPPAFPGMRLPELPFADHYRREIERRRFAKKARELHAVRRGPDLAATHVERMLQFQRPSLAGDSSARGRKRAILAASAEVELRTIQRAKLARQLKQRIAYGIPLHEWADALRRNNGVAALLQVYAPGAAETLPSYIAPRCPPWASRRYRLGHNLL